MAKRQVVAVHAKDRVKDYESANGRIIRGLHQLILVIPVGSLSGCVLPAVNVPNHAIPPKGKCTSQKFECTIIFRSHSVAHTIE